MAFKSQTNPIKGTTTPVPSMPKHVVIYRVECSPFYWTRCFVNRRYRVRSTETSNKKLAYEFAKNNFMDALRDDEPSLTARPFGWFNIASATAYAFLLSGILGFYDQAILKKENKSFINRVLIKLALTFGSLSYGIYLFHEWALVIVEQSLKTLSTGFQILLSIALTIIVAQILHKLVELPFRTYGRKLADSRTDKVG